MQVQQFSGSPSSAYASRARNNTKTNAIKYTADPSPTETVGPAASSSHTTGKKQNCKIPDQQPVSIGNESKLMDQSAVTERHADHKLVKEARLHHSDRSSISSEQKPHAISGSKAQKRQRIGLSANSTVQNDAESADANNTHVKRARN